MNDVGELIEERRKQLSISRKSLASQLGVTAQTILNIERDSSYNVGTKLLRLLEPILDVTFDIAMELEKTMNDMIHMGNDDFILYIRKHYPDCVIRNDDLGRRIWQWLRDEAGGTKLDEVPQPCVWGKNGEFISDTFLPQTATQFEFTRDKLPELFSCLDRLGLEREAPTDLD